MRFYALNLFLVFCITGYGQESLKFINYSTINGLADNHVLCITEDSRGFMWFGTSEGLSRFDGNRFENYFADPRNKRSLPDNIVPAIHEYKPGHLVLVSGATLTCLNTFTREFYIPPFAVGKNIYNISKAGKSEYVITCADTAFVLNSELKIVDTLSTPFTSKGLFAGSWYLDKDHYLIGRINEYYIYNRSQKKYSVLLSDKDMPVKDRMLTFLYYDSTERSLYFTNYFTGLHKYDFSGKKLFNWDVHFQPVPFNNGNIRLMMPKNDSVLWIASGEEQGVAVFNKRRNHFSLIKADANNPTSLVSNSVLAAYRDRYGNEWLATSKGISKLNSTPLSIQKWDPQSLGNNYPFLSIKKGADSNFYVARYGYQHIWRINKDDDSISEVQSGVLPSIWCLNNFGDNLVVTGAGTTIAEYEPIGNKHRTINLLKKYFPESDIVVLAFKHSNGDEWYSGNAGGGFVRVCAKNGTIHQYRKNGPAGNFSISYYPYHVEDKNGDLWFGVNKTGQLLHWSLKTERFNEISLSAISVGKGQVLRGITDLLTDEQGNIWIGFDGSGILKFNPVKNTILPFTIANGLSSNYVSSMAFDDRNRLWIGTLKGLTCFITSENKFINFSRKDGLPDDSFVDRCILFDRSTHLLWIGGSSALMRFNPDELLKSNAQKFPVYIDAVVVNNELFIDQNANNTTLAPEQNNVQFTFVGIDPEGGKNIEYSYKLMGADKDWTSNNTTVASYNSLGPGAYSFVVRARYKGDPNWMTIQDPFIFTIQTPWHMTWWFRISMAVAAIALSWLLIRTYYRNKFLRHKSMMEKEIAIEQERTKMARELHDGLGSMLSGIKHSFAAMTGDFNLSDKQEVLFHANLEKLNESIKELRNISHNMASDGLLKYGLENSLRDYCSNASLHSGIPVSFTALNTKDLKINEEKSVHIFRIIQELFQNIIKHAGAKNVIVQLINNNKLLYITVEDDGKGFDLAQKKRHDGIGLMNIETRIKLLKGDLDYQTAPGKGTSVLITIPCT